MGKSNNDNIDDKKKTKNNETWKEAVHGWNENRDLRVLVEDLTGK